MPEQEFGSDGQVRTVDRPVDPPATAADVREKPTDIFEASEPASAAQRTDPKHDLLMTMAAAVEHLTRNGDAKQHNEAVKAAIGAVEPGDSKFGG
jgi:hypothetical protein